MTPIDKAWVAGRTAPLDGAVRLVTLLQEAGGLQCNCRPETDGMTGDPGRTEPKSRRPCPRKSDWVRMNSMMMMITMMRITMQRVTMMRITMMTMRMMPRRWMNEAKGA